MLYEKISQVANMAAVDYGIREQLPELSRQIDYMHFSYLETDDSPEKLDQRKKLEGYIMNYLCMVPHENKFLLEETGKILVHSALTNPDFSGYRLAQGWAALARYASNLLSQSWRKEYRTIRLYSGFYKHEVEGSGLCGTIAMLIAMGYKADGDESSNTMILDGPVCPDQVAAVSRDSLMAYVECQLMTQIWEEVSMRGGKCNWLEILQCRKNFIGDVEQAVAMVLHMQRTSDDLYCNVKFSSAKSPSNIKQNILPQPLHTNNQMTQMNGHLNQANNYNIYNKQSSAHLMQQNSNGMYLHENSANTYPLKNHGLSSNNFMIINNHTENHGVYCPNPLSQVQNSVNHINGSSHNNYNLNQIYRPNNMQQINHIAPPHGYYCNPSTPFIMPTMTPYGPANVSSVLVNGYHCPQSNFCPNVPNDHLIEFDMPNCSNNNHFSQNCCDNMQSSPKHDRYLYNDNGKSISQNYKTYNSHNSDQLKSNMSSKKIRNDDCENLENIRRNSAPRSSMSNNSESRHFTLPRSDTQPSLSKTKDDAMETYGDWSYVFDKLESRGYKNNFDDRDAIMSSSLERDAKPAKHVEDQKISYTTELEDVFRHVNIKSTDETSRKYRSEENSLKKKHEIEPKVVKDSQKRQILSDDNDKRKPYFHESHPEPFISVPDKTKLISKSDAKDKKEMDKEIYANGINNALSESNNRSRKMNSKTLSSEIEKSSRRKHSETLPASSKRNHTSQSGAGSSHQTTRSRPPLDTVDQGFKTLVVALDEPQARLNSHKHSEQQRGNKKNSDAQWDCATCTFSNGSNSKACEVCGKSKDAGPEVLPLTSGGKECPSCTLVNKKDAVKCEVCSTSLENSPTYI